MAVIAMTREMATRGKDVAAGLAEKLGLAVVHHELVEHDIAQTAGLRDSEVHHLLEGEATFGERWKNPSRRLARYTREEVLALAAKGNVLIRGWGASYLLRDVPHVVCVRICAPMDYRETILMERTGIKDRAMAHAEIARSDAAHNSAMQKMFGTGWRDPTLYAATFNTARVPVADCVEHIARLVAIPAFADTEESRAQLTDKVIEAHARTVLGKRFGLSELSPAIEVQCHDGVVTLRGGTSDPEMIVQAVRLTQEVPGVKRIDNKIVHIAFGGY
jgi:cytidylate kinase